MNAPFIIFMRNKCNRKLLCNFLISGHIFISLKIRVLPLIYLILFIWHFFAIIILETFNKGSVPYA